MHDSLPFLKGASAETLQHLEVLKEFMIDVLWGIDLHVFLSEDGVVVIHVYRVLDPLGQVRHLLSTIHVSASRELSLPLFSVNIEVRILVSPALLLVVVQLVLVEWLEVDDLEVLLAVDLDLLGLSCVLRLELLVKLLQSCSGTAHFGRVH